MNFTNMIMQSSIYNVPTANWCLYTKEAGKIVTDWDAVKQRIVLALTTPKFSNPLKPYYFTDIHEYIDKGPQISIPNIKKDIVDVIGIVAPDVVVKKINHEIDAEGKYRFYIKISLAENSDVLEFDNLIGFADYSNDGTVILEADAPIYPEGLLCAELTINGTTYKTSVYTTTRDLKADLTHNYSQFGTYGYTKYKLLAYLKNNYKISDLKITQVSTIQLCDLTGYTGTDIYVTKIRLASLIDNTERAFTDELDLLDFLNNSFKITNSLLGTFMYSDGVIRYADIEGFGVGEILFDTHTHSVEYDLEYE